MLIKQNFNIEESNIQEEEVSEVKWASIDDIKTMVDRGEFWNYRYLDRVLNCMNV